MSKWEAKMHEMVELEIELRRLTYWCSINGVSDTSRRKGQELEIRIEALQLAAKLLKAEQ